MNTTFAVAGVGMATALGPTSAASCAAARAGIIRARALDELAFDPAANEMQPLMGHAASWLTDGFEGAGRYRRLLSAALTDLETSLGGGGVGRCSVVFVLPDGYQQQEYVRAALKDPEHPLEVPLQEVLERAELDRQRRLAADVPPYYQTICGSAPLATKVVYSGRCGFVHGLIAAADMFRDPGLDHCLIACVDSLIESRELSVLFELGLLRTPENPTGVLPGEAATVVLIRRPGRTKGPWQPSVELLAPTASTRGPARHDDSPVDGRALSDVIQAALQSSGTEATGLAMAGGTLNGDPWHALEWGNALPRLPAMVRNLPLLVPAVHFGDTGTCSGAVGVAFAVSMLGRNRDGQSVLLWSVSDNGGRAALVARNVAGK